MLYYVNNLLQELRIIKMVEPHLFECESVPKLMPEKTTNVL